MQKLKYNFMIKNHIRFGQFEEEDIRDDDTFLKDDDFLMSRE